MTSTADVMAQRRRRAERGSSLIERAALDRDCRVDRLDGTVVVVSRGSQRLLFSGMLGPGCSVAARRLCDHKMRGRELLARAGLPTPLARDFPATDRDAAWRFAAVLLAPVVVKPLSQDDGRGVSTGVTDHDAFVAAWQEASRWQRRRHPRRVIVEEQVEGADLRCFVVGDRMVAMVERRPRAARQPRLDADEATAADARDVSDATAAVARDAAEPIAEEHIDVTGDAHPGFAEVAVRALAAIPGLRYGAVDLIASSVTEAPAQGNHVVAEVEFAPGPMDHVPSAAEPRDVAGAILDLELDG